jgi:glucose-6-phosphate dehydrogenase assembly protein OpcA
MNQVNSDTSRSWHLERLTTLAVSLAGLATVLKQIEMDNDSREEVYCRLLDAITTVNALLFYSLPTQNSYSNTLNS